MCRKPIYQLLMLLVLGLGVLAPDGICSEFMRGADISMQTRQEDDGVIYKEYGVVPPNDIVSAMQNNPRMLVALLQWAQNAFGGRYWDRYLDGSLVIYPNEYSPINSPLSPLESDVPYFWWIRP